MANVLVETCINYCELDKAFVSSNERRWNNHIRKLAEQHPNEVTILAEPETNGGVIYAKFPPKWARIAPPKQVVISDAERARRSENLKHIIEKRAKEREGASADERPV